MQQDLEWMTPHLRLIKANAGDLVLWDSRTLHRGCSNESGTAKSEKEEVKTAADTNKVVELAKLSLAICMTSKDRASADTLEKRNEAFMIGGTLNHWPHVYRELNGKVKRDVNFKPVEMTYDIKKLIGMN